MRPPILITGAARSGTSMVAGIIHLCGAWGGQMSGPTQWNKKGMFENAAIRNDIVKPFLRKLGADPLGQNPLPDVVDCLAIASKTGKTWRQQIERIAREQGLGREIWFYKAAKACLTWPIWHAAFPDAQWVIVRRRESDIVRSCLRTGFMRAYKNEAGWQKWVYEHEKRFYEMQAAGLDIIEIWPEWMIANEDFSEIKAAVLSLGLHWQEARVREFVDPALWQSGVLALLRGG